MLSVKPVLHVNKEGRLIPLSKVRGRKQSLKALVDGMGRTVGSVKNPIVFIGHGDSLEDAEYVRDMVKERFGIQNFLISTINAVIGSHSGPGTIALFSLRTAGKAERHYVFHSRKTEEIAPSVS